MSLIKSERANGTTITDPAVMTIANPAGCAAMTATLTGVDTGTDMTATQAATIVTDLGALKTAVDANNAQIDAAKVDLAVLRTTIVSIVGVLEKTGIIKTS